MILSVKSWRVILQRHQLVNTVRERGHEAAGWSSKPHTHTHFPSTYSPFFQKTWQHLLLRLANKTSLDCEHYFSYKNCIHTIMMSHFKSLKDFKDKIIHHSLQMWYHLGGLTSYFHRFVFLWWKCFFLSSSDAQETANFPLVQPWLWALSRWGDYQGLKAVFQQGRDQRHAVQSTYRHANEVKQQRGQLYW